MNKKPVVVICPADRNNFPYAVTMLKSFRHFHEWAVLLYTNETDKNNLAKLPKNITIIDLNPYLQDPMFFYRATAVLAEPLLDEYELVLKLDADQLILGDLSYILETRDYDVGTVLNANRVDPQVYGWVDIARLGILAIDYFNCGLVAMRSKKFVHNWLIDCFTEQFNRSQYKEQDILNVLCYFGNYNVRCFDHPDLISKIKNQAWWGLIAKGETANAKLENNKIIIPKGLGDTPYPPENMELKVMHMAGGNGTPKNNWNIHFSPEIMEYINKLIK